MNLIIFLFNNNMAVVTSINSIIWSNTLKNLEEIEIKNFKGFKILRNESGYIMMNFELLVVEAINILTLKVSKRLKNLSSENWVYPVQYEKALSISSVRLFGKDNTFSLENDEKAKENEVKYGLTVLEQQKGVEKALECAKSFFILLPQVVDSKNIDSIIPQWQEAVIKERIAMRTRLFGMQILQEQVVLNQEDEEFLGISATGEFIEKSRFLKMNSTKKIQPPNVKMLDCASYALLKTRELKIVKRIRKGQINMPTDFYKEDPMKYFKKWKYEAIKASEVKIGDLVVYLDDDKYSKNKLLNQHVGFVTESGLIESKMGFNEPGISLHHLENVPGQFGHYVVFLRKKS